MYQKNVEICRTTKQKKSYLNARMQGGFELNGQMKSAQFAGNNRHLNNYVIRQAWKRSPETTIVFYSNDS